MDAALRSLRYGPARVLLSVAALALVTGLIFALDQVAPVLSLGVLYVFAVLPVAIVGGLPYAVPVAIASMLAFNFFFLPPRHSLQLTESENWVALAVYLVTAVVVSELAVRSRRRAADAEQRARGAALVAEVSAALLESEHVQSELRGIGMRVARVLGASRGSIELGSLRRPDDRESAHELRAGDRHVGRLFLPKGADPDPEVSHRVLGALASLPAVAVDRERLARRALETEALRRSDETKTTILRAGSHGLRAPRSGRRPMGWRRLPWNWTPRTAPHCSPRSTPKRNASNGSWPTSSTFPRPSAAARHPASRSWATTRLLLCAL